MVIWTEDKEKAVRIVEAFNALSVVLPIYDDEARRVFRATFKQDMAAIIPKFFMDLSRLSIKNPKEFEEYMLYMKELIHYVMTPNDKLPIPKDAEVQPYLDAKNEARKMVNSWNVRPYIIDEKGNKKY